MIQFMKKIILKIMKKFNIVINNFNDLVEFLRIISDSNNSVDSTYDEKDGKFYVTLWEVES